jgi:hypothetical protein
MVVCYLAFSSLLPLARAVKPLIGEFADVLQMAAYIWPYPVFLALQSWPLFQSLWPVFILAGLVLVVAFTSLLRKSFRAFSEPSPWVQASALVLWYVPLFLAQGILLAVVWSLGYPLGE